MNTGSGLVYKLQWFTNARLILLMLLLTTGPPLSDLSLTLFMILVTVVMGLVGALTPSTYKWGFFVFSVVTLLRGVSVLCLILSFID
jgi:bacteriorhodopsin